MNGKLNLIDLFCGCGGLTEGLKDHFNILCGIDVWEKSIDSYTQNHDHLGLVKDLREFPPNELDKLLNKQPVDVIVGGPPCQGFSIAGKRDANDPRNSLFMEFYKYIKYFKPKAFIMENVIGILSMKTQADIKVIDIIMNKFEEDYNCCINKLYTSDFEVPQNRRRTIIVGIRKDLDIIPQEISPILSKLQRKPVGDVLQPRETVDEKYFLSKKAIAGINKRREKMKNKKYGFGAQFLKFDKPSYTIPARYWKDGYDALVKYSDTEIRRLTVCELKRIQSFPDDYILSGSKKDQIIQIGNAVACRFAHHIGKYLVDTLAGEY